ncbi:MAG TPA: S6e family ribosomal protein [Candidatus Woesearchaeota archaeon]|jgi:small subunit ribosomal protein S6e|nr:S6e family ribosomal protein [Candidatus Woesearchaeota archaeon]
MAEIKLVIGTKDGKSIQKVILEENTRAIFGKKIGETFEGAITGISGVEDYVFKITGGSDSSGFPMRKDIEGVPKKKILSKKSIGLRLKRKGLRIKKTVAGNHVHEKTAQINVKVEKAGNVALETTKEQKSEEKTK